MIREIPFVADARKRFRASATFHIRDKFHYIPYITNGRGIFLKNFVCARQGYPQVIENLFDIS